MRPIILDRDIVCLLLVQGGLMGDDTVSPLSLELLADLLSMWKEGEEEEEGCWTELKETLVPLLPYMEVCTCREI